MGLSRRSAVPIKARLRASFWTSVGIGIGLLFVSTLWQSSQQGQEDVEQFGIVRGAAEPRRLISDMYPDAGIIKKPYYEDPNKWRVIFFCIGIVYMLLGLNTVCDVYFTGALDIMVNEWKIKPDVAGATFMAAGGSMPELFTSLIGATMESDVGFSTIVGSAVFNVLFVIGLCGYFAKEEMVLTWWPLFRDCSFYIVGLTLLAGFSLDGFIHLHESIILFCFYIAYCVMMYFNTSLEKAAMARVGSSRKVAPIEAYAANGEDESEKTTKTEDVPPQPANNGKNDGGNAEESSAPEATPEKTPETALRDVAAEGGDVSQPEIEKENEKGEDEGGDDDDDEHFMTKPEGLANQIIWCLSLPIYIPLYWGTPTPTKRMFFFTFLVSLIWIAGYSFLLVWWVEILGDIICKGSTSASIIMGFTVLAAGTSIPDAVSSVAVAKQGEGDMAVSSSIGSNIFDILVGLPIPWTLKIVIDHFDGGSKNIRITSEYLFFYVVLLLVMVFLTISSIHCLGWRLNWKLGVMMAVLYGLFLTIALCVELGQPEFLKQ